jgi:iron transport multicopper oxidase
MIRESKSNFSRSLDSSPSCLDVPYNYSRANRSPRHPFHLHGHTFQVITRSDDDAGFYDPANTSTPSPTPMRRDTILVRPNGHTVLRFRSDNPGIWLFHCHIEWHVASGLIATMIEAPLALQQQLDGKIPEDHWNVCKEGKVPTEGNAAGNTVDFLDLTGENRSPGRLPEGFTARGIVALVFSCLSAFLGMGVIGWYGLKPVKG